MISWRTMRIILLALFIMAGTLTFVAVTMYELPSRVSQALVAFRESAASPAPTPEATQVLQRTSPTSPFPPLTLPQELMNPFTAEESAPAGDDYQTL